MADEDETGKLYHEALELHARYHGKIGLHPKVPVETKRDLALGYTPGVAQVCREIAKDWDLAYPYTMKANMVAIVTDGSAVLGLGNIGGIYRDPGHGGKSTPLQEIRRDRCISDRF